MCEEKKSTPVPLVCELIISVADLMANDTLATHGSGFLDGNRFVHYTPDANYYGAANDEFCFERRAA